jgi:lipid-binding SYLF domain-containing protein
VVFATSWTVPPCQAASGPEIDAEVQSTLAEFFAKVGFARALANRSVAILVFPTVLKAGFGIGGEYGEGALQIRGQTAGYYNIISGSIGFQLGAQARSGKRVVSRSRTAPPITVAPKATAQPSSIRARFTLSIMSSKL